MVDMRRVRILNQATPRSGRYILYWIQASHRATWNSALQYAIQEADRHNLPVIAYFGLTDRYPMGNLRHFTFLLEGLRDVGRTLEGMGIRFILTYGPPPQGALTLSHDAAITVVDQAYQRTSREWVNHVAEEIRAPLLQVEDNVVVPSFLPTQKEEYSAATFRPKVERHIPGFLHPLEERIPRRDSTSMDMETLAGESLDSQLRLLDIDRTVPPVPDRHGGEQAATQRLTEFIETGLSRYAKERNDPTRDGGSGLSPYLHFGQISPLRVACAVQDSKDPGAEEFLEELIVRRELAVNFVIHNPSYDSFEGLPAWAKQSLDRHRKDPRPALYTPAELEEARTDDHAWNAAQIEMLRYGRMHGYMRMYWGKKILEWSATPEEAYNRAVFLNDRYELDGRDPNGYAGIAWCFGKHDRPWKERPVFGMVRYMSAAGLTRKYNMEEYQRKVRDTGGNP